MDKQKRINRQFVDKAIPEKALLLLSPRSSTGFREQCQVKGLHLLQDEARFRPYDLPDVAGRPGNASGAHARLDDRRHILVAG